MLFCIISAYLAAEDVNVLAVDWSPGAADYVPALANTPQVGERVAQFVNLLSIDFGYSAANFRIVGLGHGAHAAGIAAKTATGTIPHVIGNLFCFYFILKSHPLQDAR